MGVADTGWGILFARNAQEAADLTAIARRVAEATETPFFVVQDGFLTTHTLENVRAARGRPAARRSSATRATASEPCSIRPSALMTGVVQNQDSYMKGRIGQRAFYAPAPGALDDGDGRVGRADRPPIRRRSTPYRCEDADRDPRRDGHDRRYGDGRRRPPPAAGRPVGCVAVTSFRPFPAAELAAAVAARAVDRGGRADRRPGGGRQSPDARGQGGAVTTLRPTA